MAMKGYSKLPKYLELKFHHQMQFSVIPRISLLGGGLTPLQGIQSAYSKPYQQDIQSFEFWLCDLENV